MTHPAYAVTILNIYEFAPTAFDPGGEIGGAVSYNFFNGALAA